MTLLSDLQAAEPVSVEPPVFDAWVRETHAAYESLAQISLPQLILDTKQHTAHPFLFSESTHELDSIRFEINQLALSFVTPPSGLFYLHWNIRNTPAVRNAFMHFEFIDASQNSFYDQVVAINLVAYGSPAYMWSGIATGSSSYVTGQMYFFCEYAPNTQLDLLPVIRTSNHAPDPEYQFTSTALSYYLETGDYLFATAIEVEE